jgi:hypothetical protein
MFSLERLHTYCVLSDQSLHRDADLDGKFEGRSRACIDLRFLPRRGGGQGIGAEEIANTANCVRVVS